jgi:hypothetical protein
MGAGATSRGSEKRGRPSQPSCSMASRPLCASPRTKQESVWMCREALGQAWRVRRTAHSSAILLEREGPARWCESEQLQGETQAEPAMQKGEP